MPTKITRTWTLTGGEHNGWGFCYCCGESTDGGDFCSDHCSSIYYDVIANHIEQLPPAQFQHDCKRCQSLGGFHEFDLYVCRRGPKRTDTSLIARYGNKDNEHISMLVPEAFDGDPETYYRQSDEWYHVLICQAQNLGIL
jgi:hypothetical protein